MKVLLLSYLALLVPVSMAAGCSKYLGADSSGNRYPAYDVYCKDLCKFCSGEKSCLASGSNFCKDFGNDGGNGGNEESCSKLTAINGVKESFCKGEDAGSACGYCKKYHASQTLAQCVADNFASFCCHKDSPSCGDTTPSGFEVCKDFQGVTSEFDAFCSGTSASSACGYCVLHEGSKFDKCMKDYKDICCRVSTGECKKKPQTTSSTKGPVVTGSRRVVAYLSWKATNVVDDIKKAVDNGFNVIVLTFWIHLHQNGVSNKYWDAAERWMALSSSQKKSALDYAHARGAVVTLAVEGGTANVGNYITGNKPTGREYGRMAAQKVIEAGLDGIDFDLEYLYQNHFSSSGIKWLLDATKAARELLPSPKIISHAPQAPYLSSWAGNNHGYKELMKQAGTLIDYLFVQYYNQGNCDYKDYNTIFENHGASCWAQGSEVSKLLQSGISASKIVVGKYLSAGEGSGTRLSGKQVHSVLCQGEKKYGQVFGAGIWMYSTGSAEAHNWGKAVSQRC